MELKTKRCIPCEGGVEKLNAEQVQELSKQLTGWEVRGEKLHKTLKFADFVATMAFLNRLAEVAEAEGHHPDFCVHYNVVDVTIWTHAIDGLSENDFILAAKLDALGA
ncbi:MAG TPA: 4a-hydroxytetrahydrobiopterin dehydratase [Oscillatoriaceae cyanobacterium]